MSSVVMSDRRAPGKPGIADIDPRVACADPHVMPFIGLVAQLLVLMMVFRAFALEEPAFFILSGVTFAAFVLHYWLPFRYKEPFWIAVSIVGAFGLLEARVAALLIGSGLGLFILLRSSLSYRVRLTAVIIIFALMMYASRASLSLVPQQFWPVFGAVFMFRIIVYLYDLRHAEVRPRLGDFLSYFFVLPNYYFLLFPVIDYMTLRRSYYRRNGSDIAQQGVAWMMRGTVHLLLYRLVYLYKPANAAWEVASVSSLVSLTVLTYLLYLRVSGQFHIAIGMLHLFGYDLPETHRRYLLASSVTDFWRRINIYWKDFMVKIVYVPVYFKFRKSGDRRAKVLATAAVFGMTWALHSYQFFWLGGRFVLTWPDTVFWTVLGLIVTAGTLFETKAKSASSGGPTTWIGQPLQIAATFSFISTMWLLWQTPTLHQWLDVMTSWTSKS